MNFEIGWIWKKHAFEQFFFCKTEITVITDNISIEEYIKCKLYFPVRTFKMISCFYYNNYNLKMPTKYD